jgi:hypothetical protein
MDLTTPASYELEGKTHHIDWLGTSRSSSARGASGYRFAMRGSTRTGNTMSTGTLARLRLCTFIPHASEA